MIQELINEHNKMINRLDTQLISQIQLVIDFTLMALRQNGSVYLIGNGGSAADCQHLAAELVGRFRINRGALSAHALTTDTSIMTALGNDYGYEEVFARQIKGFVHKSDIVYAFSTSGDSKNIVRGVQAAREIGAIIIGFTGKTGGMMNEFCDVCIQVPTTNTARIQEAHIMIGHIICEIVEKSYFEEPVC
ncbi:phosphoheptose isomerase [Paenibacillus helianthi]|uniref:Phosphoheptose isomerase n=1 Tax=Paenibacillus helianthi TaxID=1349432 RepID=A0ABX3EFW4_9BACL|nr:MULTISPECIES: SIS domain-containing protein [Paenibacillus]OKP80710.1 phosphoheptose isomerase [Paenibacillus helianthi]OKP89120.1 phosphoheptose isomerase [Paenibacillus sp. P32E]